MEMNAPQSRTKLRATMARRSGSRELGSDSLNYDAEPEPNMRLSRAIAVVLLLHIVAVGGVLAFSLIKDRAPQPLTRTKPATASAAATPISTGPPATVPVANTTPAPKRNDSTAAPFEKVLSASPASANPTAPAKPRTTTYVVRNGETLARIASENSVSLGSLIAVNDARITTASLKPGQEIQIPVTSAPKDRVLDEAARLIETGGPAASPKSAPAPAKTTPTPNVAKAIAVTTAPAAAAAPAAKTAAKAPSQEADHGAKTYVVVAGDNPNTLAKKFGVSESALLKANGIEDPRKLRIGQKLVIPPKKAK
ncbi:hypothetical protein AYO41_02245 [Verrucomicrobia bacterium SCGC AG-212-E04]|nr:hypothetical protein AYO41_02245 [Verrucomicrobia bacterium SCGC AG-212-E04]